MAKIKKPTAEQLALWRELEEERLALDRERKAKAALQAPIEEQALAYVLQQQPQARVLVLHGFRLTAERRRCGVQWKPEFVRKAEEYGEDGHAAAERLIAAAGESNVLKIEPPP